MSKTKTPAGAVTGTKIRGDTLVPDFDSHAGLAVTTEHSYWMGLLASSPVLQIESPGLSFPLRNQLLVDDPSHPGKRKRLDTFGCVHPRVTSKHIEDLRALLPRLVIRFTTVREVDTDSGAGVNIGDKLKTRKGFVIKIPTKADIAAAKKEGRHLSGYVRQPDDEPAARHMFFQLCAKGQTTPGHELPPSIEEVGIIWPGELSEALDAMCD